MARIKMNELPETNTSDAQDASEAEPKVAKRRLVVRTNVRAGDDLGFLTTDGTTFDLEFGLGQISGRPPPPGNPPVRTPTSGIFGVRG